MEGNKKVLLAALGLLAVVVCMLVLPNLASEDNSVTQTDEVPAEVPASSEMESYSSEELGRILADEIGDITPLINSAFSGKSNMTIGQIKLYGKGDWCGVTIEHRQNAEDDLFDKYRMIMRKVDGIWSVSASPRLYFKYESHPQIPQALIKQINAL